jgi:ComF family protein
LRASDWVDSALRTLTFVLLPERCLLCGAAGLPLRDLCGGCLADLVRNESSCARCASPLPQPAAACGVCLRRAPAFTATRAPFLYADPLRHLLLRFKLGGELACGRVLAESMADTLAPQQPAIDLLVPVPLHRSRLAERGFNQSLELARVIARRLGIDCAASALARSRATPSQTGLDARARRRNVRGAFTAHARYVAGKRIALIDDVITTGATVRECARVLRGAGAVRVEVWAVARAEARSPH